MQASEPYYSEAQPPATASLNKLAQAAASCRACHLWKNATQTVFGEGKKRAKLMLVGEQPGDKEDMEGKPFVGPAGALLDNSLAEAGIAHEYVYITNVVKHFKWVPKAGRRIHAKPNRYEVAACLPWLKSEIQAAEPDVVVCLGATAAQALLGKDFRVTKSRGQMRNTEMHPRVFATVHPSFILRAPDESRKRERALFVRDLKKAAELVFG